MPIVKNSENNTQYPENNRKNLTFNLLPILGIGYKFVRIESVFLID